MKHSVKFLFMLLRMAIAGALLLYLSISGAIDWRSILGLSANWSVTLMAAFLLFLTLLLQSQRLCMLLRPQGMYLSLYSSLKLTLIGTFFNSCLPGATGGDAIKIYYAIEGNHGRRTEIATLILFDRVAGMFALLILPVLISPLLPKMHRTIKILDSLLWASAGIAFLMLVFMSVCFITRFRNSRFLSRDVEKLPLGNYIKRMFDTLYAYRHHGGALLSVVGISLIAHLMNVGVILSLAIVINPVGPTWEMGLLTPLGFLATTLPVTPGGIGIGEAAFNKLFILAGLSGGAELLLGWRLLTIIVGLSGLAFYLKGRNRIVEDSILLGVQNGNCRSCEKSQIKTV